MLDWLFITATTESLPFLSFAVRRVSRALHALPLGTRDDAVLTLHIL